MFEFFIALFGGLFYGGKYASYKSKVTQIKHSEDLHNAISCSREHLEKIKKQFVGDRWGMLNSISNDLQDIFGEKWKELFCDTIVFGIVPKIGMVNMYSNHWEVALNIYLSKQGYVPKYTSVGYSLKNVQSIQRHRIIKMCQIIERNINHIRTLRSQQPLLILFVPSDVGNQISSEIRSGTLMWSHLIICNTESVYTLW